MLVFEAILLRQDFDLLKNRGGAYFDTCFQRLKLLNFQNLWLFLKLGMLLLIVQLESSKMDFVCLLKSPPTFALSDCIPTLRKILNCRN